MTTPARYRTDYRLWLAVGVCVFVALGFFDPSGGGGKANSSLWGTVARLVTGDYGYRPFDLLAPIAFYSAFLAVPAALVGWAVQAVVVVRSRGTASD